MTRYRAVLFAPDGDYVTDYPDCASVDEVQEHIADQGSRWFFYPFAVVIRDRGRVTPRQRAVALAAWPEWGLPDPVGRSMRTIGRILATTPLADLAAMIGV